MPLKKVFNDLEDKMKKSVEVFRQELATVRTGIASSALVDHLTVDCYGSTMPLNQVATVTIPEPKSILIQPWDVSNLTLIEKAILKSDLGLNPNNDGKIIRINIPPLSEERRNEFVKVVRKTAEEARVAIRNIRRDANDHLKKLEKDKEITEDDGRKAVEDVQKETDDNIKYINELLEHKEIELMEV